MRELRDEKGFALTEVMVAMLVLLIVMTAMTSAVIMALSTTANNNTTASAAEAVQQRVEDVRAASVAGDCDVIEGAALPTTTVTDGRGVELIIAGTLVVAGTTADPCARAASAGDRDPVQVLRLTVTATPDLPDATGPSAQVTTDILMKFEP